MVLDSTSFEAAVIRHCSPTLAGVKPGCLFNVPGVFAADLNEEPAIQFEQWQQAKVLSQKLDRLVAKTNKKLAKTGVNVRVIAHRHCGALVYVWRPEQLSQTLKSTNVATRLTEWGYTNAAENLEASITQLGNRLEMCQHKTNAASFPHEVGFFLGYPYKDVMGFIEHNGQDYLACGCWKVYTEPERAEACFALYKRCTKVCVQMFMHGSEIDEIAATTQFAVA